MNSNNFQRGNITLSLKDPLDYEEFKVACESEGIEPLPPFEYVQKVSWLIAGMRLFPEKEPRDAYLEFVARKSKIEEIPYTPPARTEGEKKEGCCGGKKDEPLPSLSEQAKNLAVAAFEHAKDRFKNVNEVMLEKRNKICHNCNEMRQDERCAKCGCYMKIKAKWESARCPENKW